MAFSDWLFVRVGRTDSIALVRLMQMLFEFLTQDSGRNPEAVAETLWRDYQRGGRKDKPSFLLQFLHNAPATASKSGMGPKRQARHTHGGMGNLNS